MAYAKMFGREKVAVRLARIPAAVQAAVKSQLDREVADMVEAMKRACPVGVDVERHPGELRDSLHSYPNPKRDLSYRIIADAKDEQGRFIGQHVEFGHLTKDGAHVPASPFFFPTYRARKRLMRSRLAAAGRKAFKLFASQGGS